MKRGHSSAGSAVSRMNVVESLIGLKEMGGELVNGFETGRHQTSTTASGYPDSI